MLNKTKLILIMTIILVAGSVPVHAEIATVPVDTALSHNEIMLNLKNFTLDKLASVAAKQILKQMTVSTINWINSGFKGNPAFLTNPEGFFLDTADYITGKIIADNGPLKSLCSPWNVDVRLSLALIQTQSVTNQGRYKCNLDTIINNASNASVNGHSIQGFLNGDFSQGGWDGFISLTTDHNPYSDYLEAHSDLLQAIGQKSSSINQDLTQGHGFLSWQDCETVNNASVNNLDTSSNSNFTGGITNGTSADLTLKGISAQSASDIDTSNGFNLTAISGQNNVASNLTSSSGISSQQNCVTKTPGSVIESALTTQTTSGVRQLELANDINSVVNALVSQLINQMLTKGLSSLSSSGSGVSNSGQASLNSYVAQLQSDATTQTSVTNVAANTSSVSLSSVKSTYDQAVSLVTTSKNNYETARACFENMSGNSNNAGIISSETAAIDNIVSTQVSPLLTALTTKQTAAGAQLNNTNISPTLSVNANTNIGSVVDSQNQLINDTLSQVQDISTQVTNANNDLQDATTKTKTFNTDAARYQSECASLPQITNI